MRTATPSAELRQEEIRQGEELLHSLVHDLRQPLGNLETSLFYLDLVLDHLPARAREQMRLMERQVAQASQLLLRASEELRALRSQRLSDDGMSDDGMSADGLSDDRMSDDDNAASESLTLTKSATAGVT
jgi:K+-sensing histidine kinase KdpD